ncbi:GL20600 [Drosophila persimilis]|uniref:GL20600 n=1 Tax=Drosophila persimilis TaxID=7234 RepID=B4G5F0_DROPE|nr:GL20600 [Drosophila persimilis]
MRREYLNDDFVFAATKQAAIAAQSCPMGRPKDQWQVYAVIGHCRSLMHANFIYPPNYGYY